MTLRTGKLAEEGMGLLAYVAFRGERLALTLGEALMPAALAVVTVAKGSLNMPEPLKADDDNDDEETGVELSQC